MYADGYDDQLDSIDGDGCVKVPQQPGLGIRYDWEAIGSMAIERREFTD